MDRTLMQTKRSDNPAPDGDLFDFLGKQPDEILECASRTKTKRNSRKRVSLTKQNNVGVEVVDVSTSFIEVAPPSDDEPLTSRKRDEEPLTSWKRSSIRRSGNWTVEDFEEEMGRSLTINSTSTNDDRKVTNTRSSSLDTPRKPKHKARLRNYTVEELKDAFLRPQNFEKPCYPLSVSGGTAAFFKVNLIPSANGDSEPLNKYIGKSVSRAECEVSFYEDLAAAVKTNNVEWTPLAAVTLKCPGVCRLPCRISEKNEMVDLLLLENFHCGFERLRLCDIKLGEETAIAGWQGKSSLGAQSNKFVDKRTNSFGEGLRLEGMDNPPPALQGQLFAVTDEGAKVGLMRKRLLGDRVSQRCLLQRLQSADFLASWLDVSELGQGCESHTHNAAWAALEGMTKVVRNVARVPWPQTWIGSSLALGLEVNEISHEPRVLVKLFDFGRSELYTEAKHSTLSNERKEDCLHYWQQYVGALCRIHWELARIVAHRCCCSFWSVLTFEVNSESLSVVRSLLKNESRQVDVLGVGFMKVHAKNHTKLSEFEIPLHMQCSSGIKRMTGRLVVRIENNAKGISGSVVRLNISHATDMNQKSLASTAIVVRVVAFRDDDDAKMYLDSRMMKEAAPLPQGRAFAQATAPCRIEKDVLRWNSTLEFLNLGDDAVSRQKRLLQLVPECFQTKTARNSDDVMWPVLLPPSFTGVEEGRAFSQLWSQHLVPWLGNWNACPPVWGRRPSNNRSSHRLKVSEAEMVSMPDIMCAEQSMGAEQSITHNFSVKEFSTEDDFGRAASELVSMLDMGAEQSISHMFSVNECSAEDDYGRAASELVMGAEQSITHNFSVKEFSAEDDFGRAASELVSMLDGIGEEQPMRSCVSERKPKVSKAFVTLDGIGEEPPMRSCVSERNPMVSNAFVVNDVSTPGAVAPKKSVLPKHLRFSAT